ncbi:PPOX class F420-dependent oxidoreductase [Marinitenerispora sediminis]|uniref:PPOX class F420-dependent oxidoreductase n=1 Tax=Marinitenerispora sediminis TaxID=1931232 RepID=A0A368T0P5_9ACTN|nr:PPOX class F420-dependent oxidoreductase [Marinitenerispora sediminis]RCV50961.1 PPOX class F420-dependent oxidoreductase [Marinitenerispora sediminis]RCV53132.1 PPOX class F420-dependent oxidoreductase [Marinitenerispora sediminis]RCV60424.1 PPOX class F420-dependent oxidoreductase [Marinitenerispora sediminis]
MSAATILRSFQHHKVALLTTYLSDGLSAVNTPVRIVVDGDRVIFRSWEDSESANRIRHHPEVDLRPCTFRGAPMGKPVRASARLLEGAEAQQAARVLGLRQPAVQRWAVPLSHRLLRYRTLHYELRPLIVEEVESAEGWPD